jgi:hypothetical protein
MMWIIDESELDILTSRLTIISKKYSAITENATLKKYSIWNTWETGYSYQLWKNIHVTKLFKEINSNIKPLLNYKDMNVEMFFTPTEVEDQSLIWLWWFQHRTVQEYSSHITLWIWEISWVYKKEINITTPRIAVYQLGNYCTCENKIFEIRL